MKTKRTNRKAGQIFHSRALKKMSSKKQDHFHFPELSQYRNSIVGIEAILEEKLQENDKLFRGSLIKKKNILIDALEDISEISYGFGKQFQYAISFWRPSISEDLDRKLNATKSDLEKIQNQIDELRSTDSELDNMLFDLTNQIENVKNEILEYHDQNTKIKSNLFLNSDRFLNCRILSESISSLQDAYNNMLVHPSSSRYFSENQELADENEIQKKQLAKLHYEAGISNQISKRLKHLNKVKKEISIRPDD